MTPTSFDGCGRRCRNTLTHTLPALRRVAVRLGPNALAMVQRGETVGLSGGEYADLAREAAHAIVHRNESAASEVHRA